MDRRFSERSSAVARDPDSQAKSTRYSSFFAPRSATELKRRMYLRMVLVAASIMFVIWCLLEMGAYTATIPEDEEPGRLPGQTDADSHMSTDTTKIPANADAPPYETPSTPNPEAGDPSEQSSNVVTNGEDEAADSQRKKALEEANGDGKLEHSADSEAEKDEEAAESKVRAEDVDSERRGVNGGKELEAAEGASGKGVGEQSQGGDDEGGKGEEDDEGPKNSGGAETNEEEEKEFDSKMGKAVEKGGEAAGNEGEKEDAEEAADRGDGAADSNGEDGKASDHEENAKVFNGEGKDVDGTASQSRHEDVEDDGDIDRKKDSLMRDIEEDHPGSGGKEKGSEEEEEDIPKISSHEVSGRDGRAAEGEFEEKREGEVKSVEQTTNSNARNAGAAAVVGGAVKAKGTDDDEEAEEEEEDGTEEATAAAQKEAEKAKEVESTVKGNEVLKVQHSETIEAGASNEAGMQTRQRGESGEEEEEGEDNATSNKAAAAQTGDNEEEEGKDARAEIAEIKASDVKREDVDNDAVVEPEAKRVQPKASAITEGEGDDAGEAAVERGTAAACEGRWVYLYRLPQMFNRLLLDKCSSLLPWYDMCPYFTNQGMGLVVADSDVLLPNNRWFETHQYSLELLFHSRLKRSYECLTSDPEKAVLFYVPFYAALDVVRWHFAKEATNKQRDRLSIRLTRWLSNQTYFLRNGGADHVMVVGKPTWDFRRKPDGDWGNILLELPELAKMSKLLLERNMWDGYDIGVPHPTHFHPKTDKDMHSWQKRVFSHKRDSLVSFAAFPEAAARLKESLSAQCKEQPFHCRYMECIEDICSRPASIMGLFISSTFCLMPPGESAVRRAVFEAMIAGCIPVLFDDFSTASQFPWHLPSDNTSYSIYVPREKVQRGEINVVDLLKTYTTGQKKAMKEYIVFNVLPGLVYSNPRARATTYKDAFDIAIDRMLGRAKVLKESGAGAISRSVLSSSSSSTRRR